MKIVLVSYASPLGTDEGPLFPPMTGTEAVDATEKWTPHAQFDEFADNLVHRIATVVLGGDGLTRASVDAGGDAALDLVKDSLLLISVNWKPSGSHRRGEQLDKASRYTMQYLSGAIENPAINKAIVDILEGTMPAFHNRQDKYFAPLA